jgi:non-ribosomal peptide synthetase component F
MLARWRLLVEGAVANPETPIGRLPLLGKEERAQLLQSGSRAPAKRAAAPKPGREIRGPAAATPFAIAVNDGERRLTYAELNTRANGLARRLRRAVDSIETQGTPLVGLCLARSVDLIVGVLGILKAGAAYVPVDVDAPQARLRFILEDSGASLLVTRRGVLDAAPELIPPQLWVDDIAVEADGDNLDLPIPPERPPT